MNNKIRFALIPAYEPGNPLIELLQGLHHTDLQAIVIDDGSGVNFAEIFKRAAQYAVVLKHRQNYGKGRAIKTGLKYIMENFERSYTVVTMDADGQHKVSDAVKLCIDSENQPNALILGRRQLRSDAPLRSRLGNTITRFVYSFSTNLHVHDTQTGLRAFSTERIPLLVNIAGDRYEYEMNMLLECSRRKIPIVETSISTIYFDNNAASHFDTLKDSYRIYKEILKFSLSSFSSFLVDYALFTLLILLTKGMSTASSLNISNIVSRFISAGMNYSLNRRFVFNSNENLRKSAGQYALLAAGILLGNTLVLNILAEYFNINQYAAKLLTEIFFFMVSWFVQRFFIFTVKQV